MTHYFLQTVLQPHLAARASPATPANAAALAPTPPALRGGATYGSMPAPTRREAGDGRDVSGDLEGRVLLHFSSDEDVDGSSSRLGGLDGSTAAREAGDGDGDRGGDRQMFGHPNGLFVLCATETWERYSYYAMRALLVLYMRDVLLARGAWSDVWGMRALASAYGAPDDDAPDETRDRQVLALASRLYGLYTALVYLTPLLGGYLADRHFGAHPLIVLGAATMGVGHALLAHRRAFLVGAALIVLGNGCFKPNVSTRVGRLYDRGDSRRDVAFGIFYCGINLGAAVAPVAAGMLHAADGYEAGFVSAAVGMAACLATYAFFGYLIDAGEEQAAARKSGGGGWRGHDARAGGAVHEFDALEGADGRAVGSRGVGSAVGSSIPAADPVQGVRIRRQSDLARVVRRHRRRLGAMLAVCALSAGFWCAYEQQGNTTALFADQWVDLAGAPTEFVQSINPVLILALTPAVTRTWERQRRNGNEPSQITKMAIGAGLCAASYVVLAVAAAASGAGTAGSTATKNQMSFVWLFVHLAVLTTGELYLSPVGLSFITTAAPVELASVSVGAWFLSSFAGNYLSGELGSLYAFTPAPTFFFIVASTAAAVSAALWLASPALTRELDPATVDDDDGYEQI